MLTTTYLCNRVPHSALKMETSYKVLYGKEADLSHLKIIGSRAFVHIKDSTKLGHTSWEGMVCGFSENESNSYRAWNPKTRRVVEARNVVFIETPPHLIPQPSQPSPLPRLQSSSLKFTEDTLDDNYVLNEEMLQDVRDYTAALEFNIDILADPTAASKESCLRGGEKERTPNTFKEAMSLPKAAYWKEAADKEIQSLEKHGVYELVPMSFVPSSQKVVGTRWVNKIK
ncbi:unnamed protein product, partial [Ascophyllum nodosum]